MRILTELRETKNSKVLDFKNQKKSNTSEEEVINKEIEQLRVLKDQLFQKQEKMNKEID